MLCHPTPCHATPMLCHAVQLETSDFAVEGQRKTADTKHRSCKEQTACNRSEGFAGIKDNSRQSTTGIRKTRREYQQHLLSHDERHAHADLPHRLQAHRDFLGAGPVVHKLVAQVANDRLQPFWRHQIMTGLHAALTLELHPG